MSRRHKPGSARLLVRKFKADKASAGFEHPPGLGQGVVAMGNIANAKGNCVNVQAVIGQRQCSALPVMKDTCLAFFSDTTRLAPTRNISVLASMTCTLSGVENRAAARRARKAISPMPPAISAICICSRAGLRRRNKTSTRRRFHTRCNRLTSDRSSGRSARQPCRKHRAQELVFALSAPAGSRNLSAWRRAHFAGSFPCS